MDQDTVEVPVAALKEVLRAVLCDNYLQEVVRLRKTRDHFVTGRFEGMVVENCPISTLLGSLTYNA